MQLAAAPVPCPLAPALTAWQELWPPPEASSPTPAIARTATSAPMTQPRTVRNLVHSARSAWPKPSRPGLAGER